MLKLLRIILILIILHLVAIPVRNRGNHKRPYLPWSWQDLDTEQEEIADTVIYNGDTLALIRIVRTDYFLRKIKF